MTIHEVLATLKANLKQTDITLYPGANEQLIQQFEQEMNLVLPADFKVFYSFCNGFYSARDEFQMIALEEILDQKHELQPQQFYLAEVLIYCDVWEVELTNQPSGYRIHNMGVTLTDSLAAFLNRFLHAGVYQENGLYNWREEARPLRG
ncbi:SMI1/KNR4 family protein [Hymenobacter sp. BT186]|uniref:SMI1/KNR4 family protein n=1 Tax=Hymenobacter telluris TaxID=2816474 RepID=A0A939EWI1_9BACT|nr:SMI1/KNR4 family protein [Hymenobacter telluris]MBO0357877.1 SMI1/KNR4 family protein [Hymenobacter telluris]MBW3373904.1 SMI1/KNR4 family protein [Hymenobacter norwichensis]